MFSQTIGSNHIRTYLYFHLSPPVQQPDMSFLMQRMMRACTLRHSPLLNTGLSTARRRGSGSTPGSEGIDGKTNPPVSTGSPLSDLVDLDESLTVNIYRPHREGEATLNDATAAYIRTLITTPDEQEWKDMLVAAIRLNTWREHHLRAVLRSVHQSTYDVEVTLNKRENQKCSCTPSTRLCRATGVVQTAVEEGYRVEPSSVHALLVILLRGSGAWPASTATDKEAMGTPPRQLTTCAAVWQFLSWMERHNYRVMSAPVLQALERIVGDGGGEVSSGEQRVSVRQNRLEYLNREHKLLEQNDFSAPGGVNTLKRAHIQERSDKRP
uniref:Uncharacterized protein TCIL3000_11_6630 n=1 Tax=Trypanosoma congolense (strain IL3000) TaxID=1068625 RepID=G0V0R6_TRYCI|nr:unnamed protein product [Trypanosoma congolense IL3000]